MLTSSSQAVPTATRKRFLFMGIGFAACLLIGGYASREFLPVDQPAAPLKEADQAVVPTVAAADQSQASVPPATPVASNLENVDTSLIKRLLPNATVRGVDKLDLGMNTWVWEVDMLADGNNPQTAGFVYLSADGSKLLNGPLMDKRSKIGLTPPPPQAPGSPAAASSAPAPRPAVSSAGQATSNDVNQQAEKEMAARVANATLQREAFLSGIEQLPYISNTQGSNPVYVMFDPLCSVCHRLYKQQESLVSAYGIDFRWIPVFNNEKSYPVAGLLRKTYDLDKAKGLEMLDDMMSGRWKPDDHHAEFAGLTEGDYGLLGPAAAVYMEITKAIKGTVTPVVIFRNARGEVEVFGGLPLATDWLSLSNPQKS